MTEREALIAFNMIPTVGSVTVDRLVAAVGGSAAEAYMQFPDKKDWEGNVPRWEEEIEKAEKQHVRLVTRLDKEYPPMLNDLSSPPLVLYVVGDVSSLSKAGVALIGTRRATSYGKETAERFAADLVRRGWVVYSGLAEGIDGAAHRGALIGEGITVGVLGGALDKFFPESNRKLAREMIDSGGAVVSEFPFGRQPDVQTFPRRNRIVAALSRGVVAVECPAKSGTLITCSRALELHRSVMAVPGRIDSKMSAGCLNLIRDGARMVTSADDIIEELSPLNSKLRGAPQPKAVHQELPLESKEVGKVTERRVKKEKAGRPVFSPEVKISLEESAVLRAVPDSGAAIDSVIRASGLPAAKVNSLLVALRLKGKVRFLPGNRVAISQR